MARFDMGGGGKNDQELLSEKNISKEGFLTKEKAHIVVIRRQAIARKNNCNL